MNNTKKNEKQTGELQKAKNGIIGGIVLGVILSIVTLQVYTSDLFEFPIGKTLVFMLGILAFICYMVAVSWAWDLKEITRINRLEEEARKEEKEFSEIDPSQRALRAEKLYKLNQKELMRYYDMNLAQTKFLSVLGIVMIVVGIIIVAISIFSYIYLNVDAAILITGNISGIVVDFVGAIFIKMYTQNIDAAVKFHSKFAESNHLLLANSIANKIENADLREKTLSEIAKEIVVTK